MSVEHISANTGQRTRGECGDVTISSARLTFTITIHDEVFTVIDEGYRVRVEPEQGSSGVRVGAVVGSSTRVPDRDVAIKWALALLETTGILRHVAGPLHPETMAT